MDYDHRTAEEEKKIRYRDGRKKTERTREGRWRERKAGEMGGGDNREREDKEHLVKVLSVNGRVMWQSAQCEIRTSLSYNDGGRESPNREA